MIPFFLHLAGAVALLLWSVRMIRTGVERGFMRELRVGLRRAGDSKVTSLFGGAVAAIFLQSSTAVAMLSTSFVAAGSLSASAGLVTLLGADVGSTLVAQLLFLPGDAVVPILLLVGVTVFLNGRARSIRQTGRIVIGLALVLVSLDMLRTSTVALKDSALVSLVFSYLAEDLVSAFLIGAMLAWAMHSSIAAVLTFVTFAAGGYLTPQAAAALVLGANLGGAAIPFLLTLSATPSARQIVLGNILLRGGGAAGALYALIALQPDLSHFGAEPWRQSLNLHLAFNLTVAILALPMVGLLLRVAAFALPERNSAEAIGRSSALDDSVLSDPDRAIACAQRELLRMGECVHEMLTQMLSLFRDYDPDHAEIIERSERDVDRMHFQTKLYVARIQQGPLSEEQARAAMNIATAATDLEEAGDRISSTLLGMARRMKSEGLRFSDSGWKDLTDFHDRVVSNSQLALNVLMTHDTGTARQLVEEKDRAREVEQSLQARHISRLRRGNPASIETSNLHQEALRALKQVNTAFSTIAYPIAEEAGALLATRLARPGRDQA